MDRRVVTILGLTLVGLTAHAALMGIAPVHPALNVWPVCALCASPPGAKAFASATEDQMQRSLQLLEAEVKQQEQKVDALRQKYSAVLKEKAKVQNELRIKQAQIAEQQRQAQEEEKARTLKRKQELEKRFAQQQAQQQKMRQEALKKKQEESQRKHAQELQQKQQELERKKQEAQKKKEEAARVVEDERQRRLSEERRSSMEATLEEGRDEQYEAFLSDLERVVKKQESLFSQTRQLEADIRREEETLKVMEQQRALMLQGLTAGS